MDTKNFTDVLRDEKGGIFKFNPGDDPYDKQIYSLRITAHGFRKIFEELVERWQPILTVGVLAEGGRDFGHTAEHIALAVDLLDVGQHEFENRLHQFQILLRILLLQFHVVYLRQHFIDELQTLLLFDV